MLQSLSRTRTKITLPHLERVSPQTDLFEEPDDILADLGKAHSDVVAVDVTEGGVIPALSSRLVQD